MSEGPEMTNNAMNDSRPQVREILGCNLHSYGARYWPQVPERTAPRPSGYEFDPHGDAWRRSFPSMH